MINWISKLFKRPTKENPITVTDISELPEHLLWQTLLMRDNELLVFRDSNKQLHYFCTKPFDETKEYSVLVYEE